MILSNLEVDFNNAIVHKDNSVTAGQTFDRLRSLVVSPTPRVVQSCIIPIQ